LVNFTRSDRKARTQLEQATSWGRAFKTIMKELKWLNAFARLNKIACEKSLQRMAKNYLVIPDNIIEKQLLLRAKYLGNKFFHAAVEINDL